jgi:opine dehydrogenase
MPKPSGQPKNLRWTIIGGGNGGQSVCAHLAIMGYQVRLYDISPDTVDAINKQGGIELAGVVQGFGKIDRATTDLSEAIRGAHIIMVIAPATAHRHIAKALVPFLQNHQIIVLHPGATCGALEFYKVLVDEKCPVKVTIGETNTLIYACRSSRPGQATIFGIKNKLLVAALPARESSNIADKLKSAYPQVHAADNVLVTSFDNTNPIVHPAPILLNTAVIESQREWLFYREGITPAVGAFLEKMDEERIAVGKALGLDLWSCRDQYVIEYGVNESTLSDAVGKNEAYAGIKGPNSLETRYLLEDIPMGLVPLVAIGKSLNVSVERMETIIKLGEFILGKDLTTNGRTLEKIGLSEMTAGEIRRFIETGRKTEAHKSLNLNKDDLQC